MNEMQHWLDHQKNLGTVDAMRAAADAGLAPASRPRTNAHIHLPPNFTAFESVRQAMDLAAEQGVAVLGASNYYHYGVYAEFSRLARERGIFPLYGLEVILLLDDLAAAGVKVNDPGNPGKMYLCGKGITRFAPMNAEAQGLIDLIWRYDAGRMDQMIGRLDAIFRTHGAGAGMTYADIKAMVVRRHDAPPDTVCVQERHVCQAFQQVFFDRVAEGDRQSVLARLFGTAPGLDVAGAVAVQNAIRTHLMKKGKPAFVEEALLDFNQGMRLILALGGIPCYPTLADGTSPICAYEDPVEQLIETLHACGIWSAEFIPIRNQPAVLEHYVKAMREAGFVIMGGTEHNTLDLLPIEPTCLKGQAVPEGVKDVFWEGACVAAAHQFLTLHGVCGYVDGDGRLNPAFADQEQRIAAFARLGAAVIRTYFDKGKGNV
jgi:hypothetical protein